jgi:hypothetical protein
MKLFFATPLIASPAGSHSGDAESPSYTMAVAQDHAPASSPRTPADMSPGFESVDRMADTKR